MADRGANGQFLPGNTVGDHRLNPARNPGGHPKSLKTEVQDALKLAEDAMPDIIADMVTRASDRDLKASDRQQAAEYLIDRVYGKAKLQLEHDIREVTVIVEYEKEGVGNGI